MWATAAAAAAASTLVGAQRTLQAFGCLVQGWRDAGGVRFLLPFAGAQEHFVDIPFDLSGEGGGKRGLHTLQHAFPQGHVTTSKVQYEYTWISSGKREEEAEMKPWIILKYLKHSF